MQPSRSVYAPSSDGVLEGSGRSQIDVSCGTKDVGGNNVFADGKIIVSPMCIRRKIVYPVSGARKISLFNLEEEVCPAGMTADLFII